MEQSLDRSAYTYDPEQFKRVFEDKFGYLAGVKRNSRRFASRRGPGPARTSRRSAAFSQ